MSKLKKLSNEELMLLATQEFIEVAKKYRDGDLEAFEKAKYPDELARRGLQLGITRNLIHRIFMGEFDNADGLEISVKELEGK